MNRSEPFCGLQESQRHPDASQTISEAQEGFWTPLVKDLTHG